jgi:NADH-quinone oxidoreductase subunit C
MDTQAVVDRLRQAVPTGGAEAAPSVDQPTIFVARESLEQVCLTLRDADDLRFQFLVDVTAVDWYPAEPRFEVVYLLASLGITDINKGAAAPAAKRLRLKVRVRGDAPRLPTVSTVWPAAGWAEREVYDLFGIEFDGHTDLRRILMPDDWEGYPMRKDYPVQIRKAPRTQEPLQLSPEQFAANIRAGRER